MLSENIAPKAIDLDDTATMMGGWRRSARPLSGLKMHSRIMTNVLFLLLDFFLPVLRRLGILLRDRFWKTQQDQEQHNPAEDREEPQGAPPVKCLRQRASD